jgi:hypothetical protein
MGWIHVLGAAAMTFSITFLFSSDEFDLKIPFLFSFMCLLAELGVQMRWRMSIICPYCGFDPALYLRDAQLAVEKVKARLADRESDPRTLLSRQPKLDLHLRTKAPQAPGERLRSQHRKQQVLAHQRSELEVIAKNTAIRGKTTSDLRL